MADRRAMDVALSSVALLLGSPLIAVAALAVRWRMGKPVLFRQPRAGRDGVPFQLVKLRSMRPLAPEEDAPDHAVEQETERLRITRLGRFLRSTSIDELPSLLNVLRGDMSVVGPRPLPVRYLERYNERERRRLEVKPGITGWAQIHGRNAISWEERLDLDVWYVEHRTLGLDLRILAATVPLVIRRVGIAADGLATMAELPARRT